MERLSFETVNAEIEALDLVQLEQKEKESLEGIKTGVVPDVCELWKKIGVIIKLISISPLTPTKWRVALQIFVRTMDRFC